jgi:hypothetical protein
MRVLTYKSFMLSSWSATGVGYECMANEYPVPFDPLGAFILPKRKSRA